MLYATGIVM